MIQGMSASNLLLLLLPSASAYCNGMHWPARTSKAFPPGWNGLSKTPVRGWRSWYAYYTRMDQAMITEVIDAVTAKNRSVAGWDGNVSLCDLGYCMVGVDEGWEGCGLGVNHTQHFLNGTPATNLKLFPDMPGLVRYGHQHGLKMGWYFNGCGCMERTEPASGWDIDYEGDIRRLHEWGWDGVKFDGCGRLCNLTMYAELMQASGRAYEIENCHWGTCTADDASSCPTVDWCPFNWYRTSGDSNNALGTWYNNLLTTVRFQSWDEPVSQPGCWAYPDMLQVGRLGCSSHTSGCPMPQLINWTRTHFAGFCIVSSPLVLSIHPSDANLAPVLDVLGNKRAIEVNQAWAGHPGSLVRTLPPAAPPVPPLKPGPAVVGVMCNTSDATQQDWVYDATAHTLAHGSLCLSTDGFDVPLNMYTCGNASTHQRFTQDPKTNLFHADSPAPKKLYPGCLQVTGTPEAGELPVKVDVYKCKGGPGQQFRRDDVTTGMLRTVTGNVCLARRDRYVPPAPGVAGVSLWAKPLGGSRVAALFINGGGLPTSAEVTLKELNITGSELASASPSAVSVTDVWSGEDAGPVLAGGVWSTGIVAPMDSRFVIFDATTGRGTGDAVLE